MSLCLLFPLREQHRRQRHCPLAERHGVRSWVPGPWFLFRVEPGWDRAVAARVPRAHAPYLWLDVTASVREPMENLSGRRPVPMARDSTLAPTQPRRCPCHRWPSGPKPSVLPVWLLPGGGGLPQMWVVCLPGGLALPSHLPGACDKRRLRRLLLPGLVLSRGSEAPV